MSDPVAHVNIKILEKEYQIACTAGQKKKTTVRMICGATRR